MTAPAIQYATTNDGFRIAFADSGAGIPFILMPQPVSHIELFWHSKSHRALFDQLSQRYRLIRYDSRGNGLSDRDLPDDLSPVDYVADLEAVVDALSLDRFLLFAPNGLTHVAIRYVISQPDRALGLMLWQGIPDNKGTEPSLLRLIARENWQRCLAMIAQAFLPGEELDFSLNMLRECCSQADSLKSMRAAELDSVQELLPEVRVPTLLLYKTKTFGRTAEFARAMATGIVGSRLVFLDDEGDLYGYPRDCRELVAQIDRFIAPLTGSTESADSLASTQRGKVDREDSRTLTARELEVLRLVAEGRMNKEIASLLSISDRTVGRHITNIYTKIGARSKAEATAFSIRNRLT